MQLGETFLGVVDLGGTTGHDLAWIAGFAAPLSLALGSGSILLVDPGDSAGELLAQSPRVGPVALFSVPIPSDPSLAGYRVFSQALHGGGVPVCALSNAVDLTLGW